MTSLCQCDNILKCYQQTQTCYTNSLPLQRIHMKNQALFSLKDKSKKFKKKLFGALRVN